MSIELFLILILTSSFITILLTEGLKRLLVATETPHRDNIVAGFASATASTGVSIIYRIPFGLGFSGVLLLRLILVIITTWVVSMVMYDKIIQTVGQHRRYMMENKNEKK